VDEFEICRLVVEAYSLTVRLSFYQAEFFKVISRIKDTEREVYSEFNRVFNEYFKHFAELERVVEELFSKMPVECLDLLT
jgi:hypothetical protein